MGAGGLRAAAVLLLLLALASLAPARASAGESSGVVVRSCTVHFVAVSSTGEGVSGNLTVTIAYPGSGRVYISTSPASMVDTQGSARLAAFAASLLAGVDMSRLDFYYAIDAGSVIVGGPSAGAAMALATLALLEGVDCPKWVVATGMIQPDASIGPVGGLKEKLEAAAGVGARLFIIPAGQEVYTYYETVERRVGPFVIVERRPVRVNLTQLGEELGVEVYAAPTLASAYRAAFNSSLLPAAAAAPGVPEFAARVVEGFLNYTSGVVEEAKATASGAAGDLAARASRLLGEAESLYGSGAYYEAALRAVDALEAAREALVLTHALSSRLDVTEYVELVNETIIRLWGEASEESRGAWSLAQVEALAYAFAKLAVSAWYYEEALSSLEADGGYRLPYSLFTGVDTTGAELLARAWALADWAWLWLNASREAPGGAPVDPRGLREAAALLKAEAKTAAAYLSTLLQEAGGDVGAAGLPGYLAERAAAESDPVAAVGLAVESISQSTAVIHRQFTLETAETARELAALASALSQAASGLQPPLLLNLYNTTSDPHTALAAASKAVLYAWLEEKLTGKLKTPAWRGGATEKPAATTTAPPPAATPTPEAPAGTPAGGEGSRRPLPREEALAVAAFLLGLIVGAAVRGKRG
ncbi:S16 family serine protease [Stetteria hydrogenophila]